MTRHIRKIMAALLLFPAAASLHGSLPAAAGRLLGQPRLFFTNALNADLSGQGRLRRRSQSLARKILDWRPQAAPAPAPWQPQRLEEAACPPQEALIQAIADPDVRIVSLDLFDTLLTRPALEPADVFTLAAWEADQKYGVNFLELRLDAEKELGRPNAAFAEIWDHIAKRHNLSEKLKNSLAETELHWERRLSMPDPAMLALCRQAKQLGKRVVIVSDMYLSSAFLRRLLARHGLEPDAIYVSCEQGARKDEGRLYDLVLAREQAAPAAMLHIGDNRHSDYEMPLRRGISAIWRPSLMTRAFGLTGPKALLPPAARSGPYGFYLGLGIAMAFMENPAPPANILAPRKLGDFTLLALAPLITAFCARLLAPEIQNAHDEILFAGRDGWLTFNIYQTLAPAGAVPARYFQAGRRAMQPFLARDIQAHAAALRPEPGYTIGDFILAHFGEASFCEAMLASVPDRNLDYASHAQETRALLQAFLPQIEAWQQEAAANARLYYEKIFTADKALLVDTGYSGSVGTAWEQVTGRRAHKAYIWESEKNRELDRANGSTTISFCKSLNFLEGNDILLEELCSPAQPGCAGFDGSGRPRLEEAPITAAHAACQEEILAAARAYAERVRSLLDGALPPVADGDQFFPLIQAMLTQPDSGALGLFRNISFQDSLCKHNLESLQIKLEEKFFRRQPFHGTGFQIAKSSLRTPAVFPASAGVHLHVYYPELLQDCLLALGGLPMPFDLFITSPLAQLRVPATRLARRLAPLARAIEFTHTPNRGRDVAPWLTEMGQRQMAYEVFCHLHAKKSEEYEFGAGWRKFLFRELLEGSPAILAAFACNPDLGCVMPPFYEPLARLVRTYPSLNTPQEQALINRTLRERLGYAEPQNRAETIYSAGNMFWYRPRALQKLFAAGFAYEDFEPEPIGYANSLAHAIERLPGLVVAREGWQCRLTTEL